MEKGDDPVGFGFVEVLPQPASHQRGQAAIEIMRVEADEVSAAVIEGIERFEAGRDAARFAARGDNIGIVVRTDAIGAAGG